MKTERKKLPEENFSEQNDRRRGRKSKQIGRLLQYEDIKKTWL